MYEIKDLEDEVKNVIDTTWSFDDEIDIVGMEYDLRLMIGDIIDRLKFENILFLVEENPEFIKSIPDLSNEMEELTPYEMVCLNIEQYLFRIGYEYLQGWL